MFLKALQMSPEQLTILWCAKFRYHYGKGQKLQFLNGLTDFQNLKTHRKLKKRWCTINRMCIKIFQKNKRPGTLI